MHKFRVDNTLPKNIPLLFKDRVEKYPESPCQAAKDDTGTYQYYTYSQVYQSVIKMALALKTLGVKKGSNVALISDNRKEWLITDLAILSLGGADVPRGCDSMGTEIRFIISFADCEIGFFETAYQLIKVLEKADECPLLKTAILFDKPSEADAAKIANSSIKVLYYEDLIEQGAALYNEESKKEYEAALNEVDGNDNATIIFTSGTTGTPKGAQITHENFIQENRCVPDFLTCKPGEFWMTILPVWHIFERYIQYASIYFGTGLAYSKPIPSMLLKDMLAVRPQWMCGVPRLWEGLAAGVNKKMQKTGGIVYKLFKFFVWWGTQYAHFKDLVFGNICAFKKRNRFVDFLAGILPWLFFWPLHKLGNALVFKKIKAAFGGRLNIAISGGGALQPHTDNFYRAVGLNLLEGYGLTETAPVVSFTYYKHHRMGCVGPTFPGWEVKVVAEENGAIMGKDHIGPGKKGVIFVKGPQLMKGYYKRDDLTKAAMDEDGYFNTGDIGILTYDGEIKITGRAKDTIVLLGGENVEPAVLESALNGSEYIESVMVVGQDQKSLGALIVPSKEAVTQYAAANNASTDDYKELLKTDLIKTLIDSEVAAIISTANGFRSCEKIGKVALIPDSFQVGVELSAKQEMMRYKIREKYETEIKALFI
ncbi:MAG: long-chain fatty acid--CoA ligase [Treponema sp.]|nr:long-chain fatty acid--CoA ligase [Treponema sp.]